MIVTSPHHMVGQPWEFCQPPPNMGLKPALSDTTMGHLSRRAGPLALTSARESYPVHWCQRYVPLPYQFGLHNGRGKGEHLQETLPEDPISKTLSSCQGEPAGAVDTSARKVSSCGPPLQGYGWVLVVLHRNQWGFPELSIDTEK